MPACSWRRTRLVRISTELSSQIRGFMKTFGLLIPARKGSTFEKNVRSLLVDQDGFAPVVGDTGGLAKHAHQGRSEFGRQVVAVARQSQAYRILMSIPGVGTITATSFVTAIEDPESFKKPRSVGA